jgi:hypothetical protein
MPPRLNRTNKEESAMTTQEYEDNELRRAAQFVQMVAVFEFGTTRDMARKSWRKFPDESKKLLDSAVNAVIEQWDESRKEGEL